jgi:hypothetical protein
MTLDVEHAFAAGFVSQPSHANAMRGIEGNCANPDRGAAGNDSQPSHERPRRAAFLREVG